MNNTTTPQDVESNTNDILVSKKCFSKYEAERVFSKACKRLLNPGVWDFPSAPDVGSFNLVDCNGKAVRRLMRQADYIKLIIPVAGKSKHRVPEWLQVQKLNDGRNKKLKDEHLRIEMIVCKNPVPGGAEQDLQFFEEGRNYGLGVERTGKNVIAFHRNRRESMGTQEGVEKIKNNFKPTLLTQLSEAHWNTLLKSFLINEVGFRT